MTGIRLARGAIWNLVGLILPLGAALLCIPGLVHHLGADRFGLLSLAWTLVGYFTLFDLGIGPAVTRTLSACRAEGRESEVGGWFWTAILLTFGLGVVGAVLLAAAAPWVAHDVLHVPEGLRAEALGILVVLALTLPFVTVSAAAGGALAAYQRFGALNAVRLPLGILTFVAPLLVTSFSPNLVAIGAALAVVRVGGALANLVLCTRMIPGIASGPTWRHGAVASLLGFGGWMTVSAIVGPFMTYFDRLLVGAVLSLAMVAYYTTAYDLATRITPISQAIVGVLFPAMAAKFETDPAGVVRLFSWGLRVAAGLVFPIMFGLVLFAPEAMRLWLGEEFARASAPVLRWIAAGMFLNCMAQIALGVVQSSGRPRWSAVLHLIELPLYLGVLLVLLRLRGIEGAAQAWFLRVVVDFVALFVLAARRIEGGGRVGLLALGLGAAGVAAMAAGVLLASPAARAIYGAFVLGLLAWAAHRFIYLPGRVVWDTLLRSRVTTGT